MNNLHLPLNILLALLVLGLLNTCKPKGEYDTTSIHEATERIQEAKKYLISVRDTIRAERCPDIQLLGNLLEKEEQLYLNIQSWVTDSIAPKVPPKWRRKLKKLLSENERIISKEKIPYPNESFRRWFRSNVTPLESEIFELDEELKHYRRKIKRCVRKFNICKELLASGSNDWRLRAIKKLMKYYTYSDEQIHQDSIKITAFIKDNKKYKKDEEWKSSIFSELQFSLIEQLKFRLTGDTTHCHNAHIRWNSLGRKYMEKSKICEESFLYKESQKWTFLRTKDVVIDSAWVVSQLELSKMCTPYKYRRGCPDSCAINYDPLVNVNDRRSCVGCMDPNADNYCSSAAIPAPCKYLICDDDCFEQEPSAEEKLVNYNVSRGDIIVKEPSACKTKICGCTNKKCKSRYDPKAKKDDGSCNCACLDPNAANYLLDSLDISEGIATRGGSIRDSITTNIRDSIIIRGRTYYHEQSICHKRGCIDPCALNYNPKATIPNGSCLCSPITKEGLQALLRYLEGQTFVENETVEEIGEGLNKIAKSLPKGVKRIVKQFKVSQNGADLIFSANIKITKRIKADGMIDGIPIGEYTLPDLYTAVDEVVEFMEGKAGDLEGFRGTLVGEADGNKINSPGILFGNNGVDFSGEPVRLLGAHSNTDINLIKSPDFIVAPTDKISLKHGRYIKSNQALAFVRAFLVKQRMITSVDKYDVSPEQISVCAKANNKKGGKYRKISLVFTIDDFFNNNSKTLEEINEEIQNVKDAITYYDKVGYPKESQSNEIRTYDKCPCYETR